MSEIKKYTGDPYFNKEDQNLSGNKTLAENILGFGLAKYLYVIFQDSSNNIHVVIPGKVISVEQDLRGNNEYSVQTIDEDLFQIVVKKIKEKDKSLENYSFTRWE